MKRIDAEIELQAEDAGYLIRLYIKRDLPHRRNILCTYIYEPGREFFNESNCFVFQPDYAALRLIRR